MSEDFLHCKDVATTNLIGKVETNPEWTLGTRDNRFVNSYYSMKVRLCSRGSSIIVFSMGQLRTLQRRIRDWHRVELYRQAATPRSSIQCAVGNPALTSQIETYQTMKPTRQDAFSCGARTLAHDRGIFLVLLQSAVLTHLHPLV